MTPPQIAVTLAGVLLIVATNLWFLGTRRARRAAAGLRSDSQEIRITVRDGYQPSAIEVEAGRPVRLLFRREEVEGCSDTVLLPEWGIVQRLPAHEETAVEFTPARPGSYEFTCGMHMLRGRIVVK